RRTSGAPPPDLYPSAAPRRRVRASRSGCRRRASARSARTPLRPRRARFVVADSPTKDRTRGTRYRARVRWDEFAAACPELANLGEERFRGRELCLLGTLRRNGYPRISPIEPDLVDGELMS